MTIDRFILALLAGASLAILAWQALEIALNFSARRVVGADDADGKAPVQCAGNDRSAP